MAECIYTAEYNQVARRTARKTRFYAFLCGFDSSITRKVLEEGSTEMKRLEALAGNIIKTEDNLNRCAVIRYLQGRADDARY